MPELMSIPMYQCKSLSHHSVVVVGSKGDKYTVTKLYGEFAGCTCPSFKYRGDCKHLKQAEAEQCSYHEFLHGSPENKDVCPHCGGDLEVVQFGV